MTYDPLHPDIRAAWDNFCECVTRCGWGLNSGPSIYAPDGSIDLSEFKRVGTYSDGRGQMRWPTDNVHSGPSVYAASPVESAAEHAARLRRMADEIDGGAK